MDQMVPWPPSGPRADKQQRVTQCLYLRDPSKPAPAPPTEAQQRAAAAKRVAEAAADLAKAAKHAERQDGSEVAPPSQPSSFFEL